MDELIRDPTSARRLARTIVSDIAAYNKNEVERGIVEDNLFQLLAELVEEGRQHYEQRVDPEQEFEDQHGQAEAVLDLVARHAGEVPGQGLGGGVLRGEAYC